MCPSCHAIGVEVDAKLRPQGSDGPGPSSLLVGGLTWDRLWNHREVKDGVRGEAPVLCFCLSQG